MKLLIIWLLLVLRIQLHSQEPEEDILASIAAEDENIESNQADNYLETVNRLRQHPLDLNTLREEDLGQLGILNPLEREAFFQYRKMFGAFTSLYELQAVPGWTIDLIRRILPFLTLAPAGNPDRSKRQEFLLGIRWKSESAKETKANNFPGNPFRYYTRYRYQKGSAISMGATAEKDPGEAFRFGKSLYGFDFYSFHYFKKSDGPLKRIALGDYLVNMGQGLIQWQGFGFGKGSQVLQIKKEAAILQPYRGTGESNFFRGAAASLVRRNLELTGFLSYRKLTGNQVFDDTGNAIGFTSINESGLHRSKAELEDRAAIAELASGFVLAQQLPRGRIAFNLIKRSYSLPLLIGSAAYQRFAISGRTWINGSLDYSVTRKRVHSFGEFAIDKNMALAWLQGLIFAPDPRLDIAVLFRKSSVFYRSVAGNAFTEQSSVNNETGLYFGIRFHIRPHLQFSLYSDLVKFPWIRYRVDLPSYVQDYRAQLEWKKRKKLELRINIRYKERLQNVSAIQEWRPINEFRTGLQIKKLSGFKGSWMSRIELLKTVDGLEKGTGLFCQLGGNFQLKRPGFSLALRVAFYENDSKLSKIYFFEAEPGNFGNFLAVSGTGLRHSIIFKYDLNRFINFELKYAQGLNLSDLETNVSSAQKSGSQYSLIFRYVI